MSKTSKTPTPLFFPTAANIDATWEAIEKANLAGAVECTVVSNWFDEIWEEAEESIVCSSSAYIDVEENHFK